VSEVRLIAISRPVIEEVPDSAALLAYCARVSSTANQSNHETGGKLLRSLVRRKEWSPFEMVSLTMEIVTTRDIARQILRHRSFSFQEFSQRYAEAADQPILREARDGHPTDRQMSVEIDKPSAQRDWEDAQQRVWDCAQREYRKALDRGMAKEVARAVLPEGLTPSRLYMAGTLRSWLHYCELRCDLKTQKEHRLIAEACRAIIFEQFPDLTTAEPQTPSPKGDHNAS
jgi:thymidylate synthase (FAD)